MLASTADNRRMQPMIVTIEPDTEFPGHFFDHKGDEFILIQKGGANDDIR